MAHSFAAFTKVSKTDQDAVFTNQHRPWAYYHNSAVPGSLIMAQATSAAYCTLPKDWAVDSLHAQFLKASSNDLPIHYLVQPTSTSRHMAVRTVTVKQGPDIKALIVLSLASNAPETTKPQPFECSPRAAQQTLADAQRPIDHRLDDWAAHSRITTLDPFISAERFGHSSVATPLDAVYRVKLRVSTPLDGIEEQMAAIVFLSDLHVLDAALAVSGFGFGTPAVGDLERKPTRSDVRALLTINHTLHVHRASGWDAAEGILLEIRLVWARGRRALLKADMLDCEGGLIASLTQEGYYLFRDPGKSMTNARL